MPRRVLARHDGQRFVVLGRGRPLPLPAEENEPAPTPEALEKAAEKAHEVEVKEETRDIQSELDRIAQRLRGKQK